MTPKQHATGIHRTELTEVGVPYGTATYAAPEQARGDRVDKRADIFSTGVLLYEMLTGTWPFRGKTTIDVRHAVLHDAPKPVAEMRNEPIPRAFNRFSTVLWPKSHEIGIRKWKKCATICERHCRTFRFRESAGQPYVTVRLSLHVTWEEQAPYHEQCVGSNRSPSLIFKQPLPHYLHQSPVYTKHRRPLRLIRKSRVLQSCLSGI